MDLPDISTIPPAPDPKDAQADFNAAVYPFLVAMQAMPAEFNALSAAFLERYAEVLAIALAGDLPPLTGQALMFLRVNAAEDGVEFAGISPHAQPVWDAGISSSPRLINPEILAAYVDTVIASRALGEGQEWIDVTADRSSGVVYQNTTGRTIAVSTYRNSSNSTTFAKVSPDNINWVSVAAGSYNSGYFTVPPGHYYKDDNSVEYWAELREPV